VVFCVLPLIVTEMDYRTCEWQLSGDL